MKGGSPENPQFVSQYKYDLEGLYRDVAAVGGPGFIRGTHTAWRSGRYVFVGDEVFAAKPQLTAGPRLIGLGRAYGRLHVRGCLRHRQAAGSGLVRAEGRRDAQRVGGG